MSNSTSILKMDISETVTSGEEDGISVERELGVIHNVKIIGFTSENDRQYTPEALEEAIPLYEGVRVNIDHPEKHPTQQRSSYDRFGKLTNVRFVQGKGLYGDLVYLKSHPMAEMICEAAERMPELFGMSHNAQGEGVVNKKGIFVVSKVTEVRHVDVVADPATTQSLEESADSCKAVKKTKEAAYSGVGYKSKHQGPKARRGYVKAKSKSAIKSTATEAANNDGGDMDVEVKPEEEKDKELHYKVMQIITRDDMADDRKADAVMELLQNTSEGDDDMNATEAKDGSMDAKEEAKDRIPDPEKDTSTDDTDESLEAYGDEEKKKSDKKSKLLSMIDSEMSSEEKADAIEAMYGEEGEDSEEDPAKKDMSAGDMDEGEDEPDGDEADPALSKGKKERVKAVKVKESKRFKSVHDELLFYKAKDRIRELCESSGIKYEDQLVEDLSSLTADAAARQIKRLAIRSEKPKCSTPRPLQESKGETGVPGNDSLFRWLQN